MDAMKEKHSVSLDNYLQQLEFEAQSKTPLWSKELRQLRKREKILACQENYIEAQKVKDNVDLLEVEERKKALADNRDGSIARRETSFRRRQQAEVDVLQKKIDVQGETSKKRFESYSSRFSAKLEITATFALVLCCAAIIDSIAHSCPCSSQRSLRGKSNTKITKSKVSCITAAKQSVIATTSPHIYVW